MCELCRDLLEYEHFVVVGFVVVIVIVNDVEEKDVRVAVGGDGDAIDGGERYSPLEFILVVEVDKFFHECFDGVVILEHVEDGFVGEDKYPFLALAIFVEFEDVGGEYNGFLFVEYAND